MKTSFLIIVPVIFFSSCKPSETETGNLTGTKGNCTYSRNEVDPVGRPILVVEDAVFISVAVTDSSRDKALGNDFMKGYLSCVRVDTVMGIYFDFKIYSLDAYRDYGMIRKGNRVTFILASGKTVAVQFAETFSGNTNLSGEYTEYKSFSRISGNDAALLKSSELERVIISWTKIEEEYKSVNPAIFMNQLPCVEQ